jgi:hypothetical protein
MPDLPAPAVSPRPAASTILNMPQENCERMFETFIRWARFGNLFAYEETRQAISLQS